MLEEDDRPNRIFLTFLFCDKAMALQLLKDMGLRRKELCNTCGGEMTSVDNGVSGRYQW